MQLLRHIFGLNAIYAKQTIGQTLYVGVYGVFALSFLFFLTPDSTKVWVCAIAVVELLVLYVGIRIATKAIAVRRRLRSYETTVVAERPQGLAPGSVDSELDGVDTLRLIMSTPQTRAFLATYNFYTRTKYGDFLAKSAYYTIIEARLDRVLPHVLFDSKHAKGQQFKHMYLKTQQLSVQGSFDDVFATYVPHTYAIDSLSFVTPEVMELLVKAKHCDIEIVNDTLLLYAPLVNRSEIDALVAHGQAIAQQLNDNIDTYRDDRLRGTERKTVVTPFARTLLRSPFKHLLLAGILGSLTLGLLIASIFVDPALRDDLLWNQISTAIYIFLIIEIGSAYKIMRDNRKALERYRILYQTNRGKPIRAH